MAGKRAYYVDGLIFSTEGALNPDGFTIWVDKDEGWGSGGSVRRDRTPRLWAHGEFSERGWRGARLVTLEGEVRSPTEQVAALAEQSIAALLADGTDALMAVTDSATVLMSARVGLADVPKIGWINDVTMTYQVQLLCPDGRKYGEPQTAATGPATPGGGLAYDLDDVLDYGALGDPGTLTLTNGGKADTSVLHTLTGSAPNGFTVTHVQTGRKLIYSSQLAAGQTLTLDSDDGTVTLDGYADRGVFLTRREWVRLEPGETGTWLLESFGSSGLQLTTEVRPAWW